MRFRVLCRETPGHVSCHVYTISETDGLSEISAIGLLVVRQGEEFESLKATASGIEFVDEATDTEIPKDMR